MKDKLHCSFKITICVFSVQRMRKKNESEAFKNWCECLREESVRLDDVDFFDGMN